MNTHRPHSLYADLATGIVIIGFAAFAASALQDLANYTGDAVRYLGLAQSLNDSGSYEFNSRAHTRFPPGFPLLLATLNALGADSYHAALSLNLVCALLSLPLCYLLLRSLKHPWVGVTACAALASSPYFFVRATEHVGSDFPFLVFCYSAIIIAVHQPSRLPFVLRALLLSLLVILSVTTRSAGLSLIAALIFSSLIALIQKRKELPSYLWLISGVVGAAAQLCWMAWQRANRVSSFAGEYMNAYNAQFILKDPHQPELGTVDGLDLIIRVFSNAVIQAAHFSELLANISWVNALWFSPLVLLPVVFILTGLTSALRRGELLIPLFLIFSMGLILTWPFDEGQRYLLPVFPIAFLYFIQGAACVWEATKKNPSNTACIVFGGSAGIALYYLIVYGIPGQLLAQTTLAFGFWVVVGLSSLILLRTSPPQKNNRILRAMQAGFVLICVLGIAQQKTVWDKHQNESQKDLVHSASIEAASWIAKNTDSQDVIMAGQEAIVFYLSKRKAVHFPVNSNPLVIRKAMLRHGVRYLVVISDERYPYFFPTEQQRLQLLKTRFPDLLEAVVERKHFLILRASASSTLPESA